LLRLLDRERYDLFLFNTWRFRNLGGILRDVTAAHGFIQCHSDRAVRQVRCGRFQALLGDHASVEYFEVLRLELVDAVRANARD